MVFPSPQKRTFDLILVKLSNAQVPEVLTLKYSSLSFLLLMYFVFDISADEEGIGGDHDSDNPLMMLFNDIQHFTDPTGRALSEPFLRLPSRRFVLVNN